MRAFLTALACGFVLLFTAAPTGPVFNNPPRNLGTVQGAQQAKAPYILVKGGVPLVSVATGTMANNGAMTVGTALPITYPNAYFFMPAGSIAAGVPASASWVFGQCSSGTACTLFNNIYTSGIPTAPASPTAFTTTGPGAFTGDTAEEFAQYTLPANAMGANGVLRFTIANSETNNADSKTFRVRWSGTGGTVFIAQAPASVGNAGFVCTISNTATNANISACQASNGAGPSTFNITGTIDSTASTTIAVSVQKGTATDNAILMPPLIEVLSDGT